MSPSQRTWSIHITSLQAATVRERIPEMEEMALARGRPDVSSRCAALAQMETPSTDDLVLPPEVPPPLPPMPPRALPPIPSYTQMTEEAPCQNVWRCLALLGLRACLAGNPLARRLRTLELTPVSETSLFRRDAPRSLRKNGHWGVPRQQKTSDVLEPSGKEPTTYPLRL